MRTGDGKERVRADAADARVQPITTRRGVYEHGRRTQPEQADHGDVQLDRQGHEHQCPHARPEPGGLEVLRRGRCGPVELLERDDTPALQNGRACPYRTAWSWRMAAMFMNRRSGGRTTYTA